MPPLLVYYWWMYVGSHLMLSFYSWLQQSAAFKILRTRLKTVPSYSFDKEQLKRTSSGMHFADDNSMNDDSRNMHNGINFASWLQRFEQMQQQHRLHYKSQAQSQKSSTSSSKVPPLCCFSPYVLVQLTTNNGTITNLSD